MPKLHKLIGVQYQVTEFFAKKKISKVLTHVTKLVIFFQSTKTYQKIVNLNGYKKFTSTLVANMFIISWAIYLIFFWQRGNLIKNYCFRHPNYISRKLLGKDSFLQSSVNLAKAWPLKV